jgi:hypothetical protein
MTKFLLADMLIALKVVATKMKKKEQPKKL